MAQTTAGVSPWGACLVGESSSSPVSPAMKSRSIKKKMSKKKKQKAGEGDDPRYGTKLISGDVVWKSAKGGAVTPCVVSRQSLLVAILVFNDEEVRQNLRPSPPSPHDPLHFSPVVVMVIESQALTSPPLPSPTWCLLYCFLFIFFQ